MPTVIDEFVAVFSLDPTAFKDGAQEVRMEVKRTREAAGSATQEMGSYGKQLSEFFRSARSEALGLFLAFQGASSLKGFISDIISGDAATSRLAGNLGLATNELSAWQLAVQESGGVAEDANSALGVMANAYQQFLLTGTTGNDSVFKSLGVTKEDLANPTQALLKLAEAAEKLPKTEFYAKAKMLGIPDSVIYMLERGRGSVEALVEAKKKNGAASDADAAASERLERKLADLRARIMRDVRPAVYWLVDGLEGILTGMEEGTGQAPLFNLALGAVAVAAAAAGAPLIAMGAALALIITNWSKLEAMWKDRKNPKGEMAKMTAMGPVGYAVYKLFGGGDEPGAPAAGAGASAAPTGTAAERKKKIENHLLASGLSSEQVRGIVAGIAAENSTFDPNIRGGYKNRAVGIGQWLGPRRAALLKRFGNNPTLDQQLQFLVEELRGGDRGGSSVLAQGDAEGAMVAYLRDFMRPAEGLPSDLRRGYAALGIRRPRTGVAYTGAITQGGGGGSTSIGTINVYTAATDGKGIARDLPVQLQRRGVVMQANRGLE